jgi:hypothetical protein
MSKYHAVSSGMVTRQALPSITRQRGTTTGSANLMLYGAGKTTVSNNTTFIDSSANAFTVTRNGDTVQSGFNPFSQASSGSGYFDGNGDYLSCASNAAFAFGSGDFTIEYWLYASSWSLAPTIVDTRTTGNSVNGYSDFITSGGVFNLFLGNTTAYTMTGSLPLNTWTHIAVSRSGTSLRVFINGTQNGSTVTNSTVMSDTNLLVAINRGIIAGTIGPSFFNGYLSNVRLVKGTAVYTSNFTPPTSPLTAITNTSLLLLMDNYSIVNSTATSLPVTINGNTTISTAQFPTGMSSSIYFDGTGDYLTVPSNAAFSFGTGDFTIEFWMYMTSYGSSNQNILDFRGSTGTGTNIAFYVENVGGIGTKQLRLYNGASDAAVTSNNFPLNTWSHVAATRSGTSLRFFVDGVQVGATSTNSTNYSNTAGVYIGAYSGPTAYYYGYISNLRICKGTALYTANFTPPSLPMSTTVSVPAFVTNNIYGVNQIP